MANTAVKDPDPKKIGCLCSFCPFSRAGQPVSPVFGEGPRNPLGVVVAESPGYDEIQRHKLLVGATGQEFDKSLLAHGLKRSQLYIVNAIACMPVGPKSEPNMQRAAECCRPLVLYQTRHFGNEPHVLALGKWAWFSITGLKTALRNGRGFLRQWTRHEMEVANDGAVTRLNKEYDHTLKEKSK